MLNRKEIEVMAETIKYLVLIGTGQIESNKAIAAMAGLSEYSEVKDLGSYEGEDFELEDGTQVFDGDQVYEVIA